MKLSTPLIASILVIFLSMSTGQAQTIFQPEKARLSYKLKHPKHISQDIADTLLSPSLLLSSTDTLQLCLRFSSPDTVNISKIHVKLGTTESGEELLLTTYDFDSTSPSNGLSYFRTRERIRLDLGEYPHQSIIYCDVWFEDTSGNLSAVTTCQTK